MKLLLTLMMIVCLSLELHAEPASGKHYHLDFPSGWTRNAKSTIVWEMPDGRGTIRCTLSELEPSASLDKTSDQSMLKNYSSGIWAYLRTKCYPSKTKHLLQVGGRPTEQIKATYEDGATYATETQEVPVYNFDTKTWGKGIENEKVRTKAGLYTVTNVYTVLCQDNSAVLVLIQGTNVTRRKNHFDSICDEIVGLIQIK